MFTMYNLFKLIQQERPDCEVVVYGSKRPTGSSRAIPARVYGRASLRMLGIISNWNLQPDITVIDHDRRTVEILEIGITNPLNVSKLQVDKPAHYNRLKEAIVKGGKYTCQLDGMVLGNLGQVPQHALQILRRISKTKAQTAMKSLQKISRRIVKDGMYLLSASFAP